MRKLLWFSALIGSGLMTAVFSWLLAFYLLHYPVTWRGLVIVLVVGVWIEFTRAALAKFTSQISA